MKIQTELPLITSTILLIDDVPANLKLLGNILIAEGHRILQATNGELALKAAQREKPDLILLDINMPGMDGFEVCTRLKGNPELQDIPVIFISASDETNDIVQALTLGGIDYINKPFRAEEVLARVRTHVKLNRQSRELQELNATKDKFFSIIAHDLRGPFSAFLGFTEIMTEQSETLTREQIHDFSLLMHDSATNLFSLLENLLEWSRMQRQLTDFDPKSFLLRPFIEESILYSTSFATIKGINLRCNIPADLEVFADAHMLSSIIRNLIANGIKFTRKGGEVLVSAQRHADNTVSIAVKDSGIGMSRDLLDNLFRIDKKTNRKGTNDEPSSGLGLILCKDFIERHGGKIGVESEEEKGSVFHFTLQGKR